MVDSVDTGLRDGLLAGLLSFGLQHAASGEGRFERLLLARILAIRLVRSIEQGLAVGAGAATHQAGEAALALLVGLRPRGPRIGQVPDRGAIRGVQRQQAAARGMLRRAALVRSVQKVVVGAVSRGDRSLR